MGLGHGNVHPFRIGRRTAANVGIPGAHGPAGRIVGVQGDGVSVVRNGLQGIQELGGRLGQLGDAGGLKHGLVINDALGVAGGGDAVDLAVVGAVVGKVVFFLNGGQVAHGVEVIAQFRQRDGGGDHADIAPVVAGQAGGHITGVVGDALVADGDVGVHLVEGGDVFVKGAVLNQVGAVADDAQLRGQVGVILADGQLVISGDAAGLAGLSAAAASRAGGFAAAAAGQQAGGHGSRQGQCKCFFHGASPSCIEAFGVGRTDRFRKFRAVSFCKFSIRFKLI